MNELQTRNGEWIVSQRDTMATFVDAVEVSGRDASWRGSVLFREAKMTKPYTEDEVRDIFLRYIHNLVTYWDSVDERDCIDKLRGLAFSILVTLDGVTLPLPAFKVIPDPHPDDREYHQARGEKWFPAGPACEVDIAGCLHERFHSVLENNDGR